MTLQLQPDIWKNTETRKATFRLPKILEIPYVHPNPGLSIVVGYTREGVEKIRHGTALFLIERGSDKIKERLPAQLHGFAGSAKNPGDSDVESVFELAYKGVWTSYNSATEHLVLVLVRGDGKDSKERLAELEKEGEIKGIDLEKFAVYNVDSMGYVDEEGAKHSSLIAIEKKRLARQKLIGH